MSLFTGFTFMVYSPGVRVAMSMPSAVNSPERTGFFDFAEVIS